MENVAALSWSQLNRRLMETDDEAELRRWLCDMTEGGASLTRVLRVHGRLATVHYKREREELRDAYRKRAA